MKQFGLVFLVVMCSAFIMACESSEDDKINQAQACLDRATDATSANECVSKVSGISGARAAVIRCSASFIAEGFTTSNPARFVKAFKAIEQSEQGGVNSTVVMMTHLAFSNQTDADAAAVRCNETGLIGFIMFANMAKLATRLKTLAGIADYDPDNPPDQSDFDDMAGAVSGLSDAEAGQVAKSVGNSYCATPSNENVSFCQQMKTSLAAGASDAEVGAAFKDQLN